MTIGNISTYAQSQVPSLAGAAGRKRSTQTQSQVASGLVSTTYGGIGDKTAMMESAQSQANLATAYSTTAQLASTQVNLQDTQLTQLASLASQFQQDITTAVANNSGSTLMSEAQSIYSQAVEILNSQDANGHYIYGGGNDSTPPVTATTLSALTALPTAAAAFANGTQKASVQIGSSETAQIGVLASDVGTQLLQSLQDVVNFNNGANGNFGTALTSAQSSFLSNEIPSAQTAAQTINSAVGANGEVYQQLQSAVTQQQSMSTLYKGFVSDIQNVYMATAAANLSQNQVALQAALEVTSQLGKISLLSYLSPAPAG